MLLRKLASVYDHVEIDPSPIRNKIREIIGQFEHRFADLQNEKDENLVVCGSFIKTFGNGTEQYISHIPITNAQILASIFFTCPFAHPSVMIKKEALLQLEEAYREDYKHSEDYDLWSRLVFVGNSINIPEFLLNYRISKHLK